MTLVQCITSWHYHRWKLWCLHLNGTYTCGWLSRWNLFAFAILCWLISMNFYFDSIQTDIIFIGYTNRWQNEPTVAYAIPHLVQLGHLIISNTDERIIRNAVLWRMSLSLVSYFIDEFIKASVLNFSEFHWAFDRSGNVGHNASIGQMRKSVWPLAHCSYVKISIRLMKISGWTMKRELLPRKNRIQWMNWDSEKFKCFLLSLLLAKKRTFHVDLALNDRIFFSGYWTEKECIQT